MLSCVALMSASTLFAQKEGVTQCGVPTGQPAFPLYEYNELPDPKGINEDAWKVVKSPLISWGSIDKRYAKHEVPELKRTQQITLQGWRGEKMHAQAVVSTNREIKELSYVLSEFKNGRGDVLPNEAVDGGFVRYVITDQLNLDGKGGCGHRPDHTIYDSTLVADVIDHHLLKTTVAKNSNQCIWINCKVPATAAPGTYRGTLTIKEKENVLQVLKLNVRVSSRVLPEASKWKFHLDLWQNPYAVARYYQVPVWSQEHLDAMRPVMKMLADAGQKIITASIMHKPWNGQTEDFFESMITWTKKLDGSWEYDYDIFDRWVEFMMSVGIDKQINTTRWYHGNSLSNTLTRQPTACSL